MHSDEDELCPPPGSEEEELSLPRASINKMIKEMVIKLSNVNKSIVTFFALGSECASG